MNRTPPGEAVEKDTSTAGSHRGPAARPAPHGPARPPPPGPAPSPPARRRPRCPTAPSRRRAQPIRAAAAFSQPMGEARGWRPRPPPRQAPPAPCEAAGRWRMAALSIWMVLSCSVRWTQPRIPDFGTSVVVPRGPGGVCHPLVRCCLERRISWAFQRRTLRLTPSSRDHPKLRSYIEEHRANTSSTLAGLGLWLRPWGAWW